jgi:hypothetical protein
MHGLQIRLWKASPRYPGFEVRPDGRIRSAKTGKILKSYTSTKLGHQTIGLSGGRRGATRTVQVHTLMLETFLGARPDGLECAHITAWLRITAWSIYVGRRRRRIMPIGVSMAPYFAAPVSRLGARTHCNRGHEFTPENTRLIPAGRGSSDIAGLATQSDAKTTDNSARERLPTNDRLRSSSKIVCQVELPAADRRDEWATFGQLLVNAQVTLVLPHRCRGARGRPQTQPGARFEARDNMGRDMTKKRRTKDQHSIVDDLMASLGVKPERSGMPPDFWQRFAGVMRNAPMARELDPVERTKVPRKDRRD